MIDNQTAGEPSSSAQPQVAAPTAPTPTHQPTTNQPATEQPTAQPTQEQANYYAQYPNAYGQQFQTYQQYGYQPYYAPAAAYSQPAYPQAVPPPKVHESKQWVYIKSGLHAVSALFSIIALALSLSMLQNSEVAYYAAIGAPVPVMTLIWSAAELIVRAVHKFESGIHPGGSVAATLIIWLAAAIVGILEGLFTATNDSYYCDSEWDSATQSYYDTGDCDDPWEGTHGVWIAVTVFTCLLWAIYFALFVAACMDTAKRNAAKRSLVMVVNPAYWGAAAQGWQPMPQGNVPATPQQGQQPQQPQHQQQYQQYTTVPQPAMTHGANGGHEQDIPLQNRTPSPATPYATPGEGPVVDEKGKAPEQGHGIAEFYTPGGRS